MGEGEDDVEGVKGVEGNLGEGCRAQGGERGLCMDDSWLTQTIVLNLTRLHTINGILPSHLSLPDSLNQVILTLCSTGNRAANGSQRYASEGAVFE